MKQNFDKELMGHICSITGLVGDELYCLTGVVYATAFIGKMPTKDDLANYLGVSRRANVEDDCESIFAGILRRTERPDPPGVYRV